MTRAFLAILRRDLALASRAGGGGDLALVFFLTIVVLVPFALGPDLNLLSRIGPAILWLGALLSMLIGLDRLVPVCADESCHDRESLAHLHGTDHRRVAHIVGRAPLGQRFGGADMCIQRGLKGVQRQLRRGGASGEREAGRGNADVAFCEGIHGASLPESGKKGKAGMV